MRKVKVTVTEASLVPQSEIKQIVYPEGYFTDEESKDDDAVEVLPVETIIRYNPPMLCGTVRISGDFTKNCIYRFGSSRFRSISNTEAISMDYHFGQYYPEPEGEAVLLVSTSHEGMGVV